MISCAAKIFCGCLWSCFPFETVDCMVVQEDQENASMDGFGGKTVGNHITLNPRDGKQKTAQILANSG